MKSRIARERTHWETHSFGHESFGRFPYSPEALTKRFPENHFGRFFMKFSPEHAFFP